MEVEAELLERAVLPQFVEVITDCYVLYAEEVGVVHVASRNPLVVLRTDSQSRILVGSALTVPTLEDVLGVVSVLVSEL